MSKIACVVEEGKVTSVLATDDSVEAAFAVYGDEVDNVAVTIDDSKINEYESRCTFTSESLAADEAAAAE